MAASSGADPMLTAYGKAEYNRPKKASYELGAGGQRAVEVLVDPGTQAVQHLLKASESTTAPAGYPTTAASCVRSHSKSRTRTWKFQRKSHIGLKKWLCPEEEIQMTIMMVTTKGPRAMQTPLRKTELSG